MTSKIDICNLALANLGQPSINALTDENERARKCELFYDLALGETLRAHPWKFAQEQAPLSQLDVRHPHWGFVYAYPQDAAFVHTVKFGPKPVRFFVSSMPKVGRVVLTHTPLAFAEYTRNETNPDRYDADFVRVMSWVLACDVALSLTGDRELMQLANAKKESALDEARYNNRQEGDTRVKYECSYLK